MRSSDETRPQDIIFLFCFCFKPKRETHAHHSLALLETSVELLHRSRSVFFNLHSLCQMAAPGGPSTDTPHDLSLLCACLLVYMSVSLLFSLGFYLLSEKSFTEPLYMRLSFPVDFCLSAFGSLPLSLSLSLAGSLSHAQIGGSSLFRQLTSTTSFSFLFFFLFLNIDCEY